jgi:hypothetical protein
LKNNLNFHRETMCMMFLFLAQNVFFRDKHDFWHKNITLFSQGNNVPVPLVHKIHGYFLRWTCVLTIHVNRLIWSKMNLFPPSNFWFAVRIPLKTITQLWQGSNVLDTAASNVDHFPWRDTCVPSPQLTRPLWSKQSLSPLWNTKVAGIFPFKT